MKGTRKLFYALCIVMLTITGCSIKTQSNTDTTQSQPSSASMIPNYVSSKAVVNNSVSSIIQIKNSIGKPIKASNIFINNINLYYISPINGEITCTNKNAAVKYSNNSIVTISNIGKLQFINESPSEMLLSNNIIYYTNREDDNKIYTIGINGQNKKKLVNEPAHNMILMGSYIYYLNGENILKVFDASTGVIYTLQINAICFDSDGTNIYYEALNSDGHYSINSIKIDGSGVQCLNNDSTTDIIVNNGKVFYANEKDGQTLYYTTTDGKTRARFTDIQAGNIKYGGGYIYYTDDFNNLYKIRLDGSLNTKVINDPFVSSFIVDNGIIYFTRDINTEDVIYKITG